MKKVFSTILVLALCVLCLACGAQANAPASAPASPPEAAAAPAEPAAPAPASAEPVEAPVEASAPATEDTEAAPGAPTGPFTQSDLGFAFNGKTYYLREDSAELLAALGDDYEFSEIVSCVYSGMDKTYAYDGVTVNTVPVDGEDIIEMITLTDGTYETLRGVKPGQDMDAITAAYGEDYFDDGYITYSLTNDPEDIQAERIQFEFDGDAIGTIYIYSPSY